MKSMPLAFVLPICLLGATNAFAGQWVCSNMSGNSGYAVAFSPDGLTAEVRANGIDGEKVVATLSCDEPRADSVGGQTTTTVCTDQDSKATDVGKGYKATLRGGREAVLSSVILRHGGETVARIACSFE